jgi:transposase
VSGVVEGATTKAIFEAYVERVLAPALSPGQFVVMDNLTAHKGSRVRELVEGRGCELLYLPPYSPDFSPIEEAFSKVKAMLKKACARAPAAHSWKRSLLPSRPSRPRMRRVSLATVVICLPLNHHEKRCKYR